MHARGAVYWELLRAPLLALGDRGRSDLVSCSRGFWNICLLCRLPTFTALSPPRPGNPFVPSDRWAKIESRSQGFLLLVPTSSVVPHLFVPGGQSCFWSPEHWPPQGRPAGHVGTQLLCMGAYTVGHCPGRHHTGEKGFTWHNRVCGGMSFEGRLLDTEPILHLSGFGLGSAFTQGSPQSPGRVYDPALPFLRGVEKERSICPGHWHTFSILPGVCEPSLPGRRTGICPQKGTTCSWWGGAFLMMFL